MFWSGLWTGGLKFATSFIDGPLEVKINYSSQFLYEEEIEIFRWRVGVQRYRTKVQGVNPEEGPAILEIGVEGRRTARFNIFGCPSNDPKYWSVQRYMRVCKGSTY